MDFLASKGGTAKTRACVLVGSRHLVGDGDNQSVKQCAAGQPMAERTLVGDLLPTARAHSVSRADHTKDRIWPKAEWPVSKMKLPKADARSWRLPGGSVRLVAGSRGLLNSAATKASTHTHSATVAVCMHWRLASTYRPYRLFFGEIAKGCPWNLLSQGESTWMRRQLETISSSVQGYAS